jgi:hypothetical protein
MFNFIYFTFVVGLRELEFFVLLINLHSLQGFCCEKRFVVLVISPFAFFLIKSISIQTKPSIKIYLNFIIRLKELVYACFFG